MTRAWRRSIASATASPACSRGDPLEHEGRGQVLLAPGRLPALLERLLHHHRVDEPEVSDGRAGAMDRELGPERPAELLHTGLGDRVGRVHHPVQERVHARDEDQLAAARDDLLEPGVRRAVDAQQVDLDDPLELVGRHHPDRRGCRRDPGVGDDDVDDRQTARPRPRRPLRSPRGRSRRQPARSLAQPQAVPPTPSRRPDRGRPAQSRRLAPPARSPVRTRFRARRR